ncbi:hypothetical protein N9262_02320 [Akkermansiaceae bacterium]|nr:hypothetical protein [Akkermansiaceae bacterium]
MATPTYTLLGSTILSSSASSVTFTSISQDYGDLVMVIEAAAATSQDFYARIRYNDSTSNYHWVSAQGQSGNTVSYSGVENGQQITNAAYLKNNNEKSLITVQIMNYSATNMQKTMISEAARYAEVLELLAGRWESTAAINKVHLYSTNGANLAAGAKVYLYGIAKVVS